MTAKNVDVLVVHLADTDHWGFDEVTLPMLLHLVDESGAADRHFAHTFVTAYWVASDSALGEAARLVADAEALRDGDPRFRTLGIGVARGAMLADIDRRGRFVFGPVGRPSILAVQMADSPGAYVQALANLRGETGRAP